ncbi:MAG: winged helix-turn-helix transcriptional regulator [Ardenticatenaceae bacterium]|nr:winged helix-turn-helix transcriptional regulator [Anaerolineales bacterium]MCB8940476.1 winged helix-turn-helix transcriptional regulator [Ardenticatenaceae bacterium]MCB8973493.1 winged helix-turn-helix transcriptional regulator [Ardenticatenaceae bacterium]MCP5303786.1 winged helix-turn-helix transcriptional regulator [Pseudomonadales bacterium]
MNDFVFDPNTHESHIDHKIVFALERLSQLFRIQSWEANKQFQLSPLQMQIVTTLRFQPHLDSVTAVASYLQLTNATVSDAVRVLNQKQYVEKRPDPEDGRRHHLTLTVAGANIAEELSLFANQIGEFVSLLPNQAVFLESLLQLMQLLQENGFIPLQQMCTTCRHLVRPEGDGAAYYCQLLDKPLAARDLRVYCPEYETAV